MQVSHSSVKVGGFVSATPLPPTIRRRDLAALVSVEHILSRLNPEGTLAREVSQLSRSPRGACG